jgi:homogentisate 1,2-dioxygenase
MLRDSFVFPFRLHATFALTIDPNCVQQQQNKTPTTTGMTEFMGNIRGQYEAKEEGFLPGGATLHSCMVAHGPDADCFEKASAAPSEPQFIGAGNLAFMFESTYGMRLTRWALGDAQRDADYHKCWSGLKNHFRAHMQQRAAEEEE